MSTLNVRKATPTAGSEYISRFWAEMLRGEYRRLRLHGVPRSTARSVLHTAYHVGLNAARDEAHERRMAEIRRGSAA